MASSLIANSNDQWALGRGNTHVIATTGSRRWIAIQHGNHADGQGIYLWYSDDGGATWTKGPQVTSTTSGLAHSLVAYQDDSNNHHLAVVFAGGSTPSTTALTLRQLHTNVASGTPGALTTAVTIDAGGTGLGVINPVVRVSRTATNPRMWIYAKKQTTSGPLYEGRLWYCALGADGSTPDTGANWQTPLTVTTNNSSLQHDGVIAVATIGGNTRMVIVAQDAAATPDQLRSWVFDPAATTPSIGTSNVVTGSAIASGGWASSNTRGVHLAITSPKADYLVIAFWDTSGTEMRVLKSVDGATWTKPSGWGDHAGYFPRLISDGSGDVHLVYLLDFDTGNLDDAKDLYRRKITTASDSYGAADTTVGDFDGYTPQLSITGSDLRIVARGGTAAAYGVRQDIETSVVTASETAQPPTNFTATPQAGGVLLQLQMPNQSGREITIRRGTAAAAGATPTAPASSTDGDEVLAWEARDAQAAVSLTDIPAIVGADYAYAAFTRVASTPATISTAITASGFSYALPAVLTPITDTETGQPYVTFVSSDTHAKRGFPQSYRVLIAARTDTGFANPILDLDTRNASTGAEYEASPGVWTAFTELPTAQIGKNVRIRLVGLATAGLYRGLLKPRQF